MHNVTLRPRIKALKQQIDATLKISYVTLGNARSKAWTPAKLGIREESQTAE
jgi:hypothetical protein